MGVVTTVGQLVLTVGVSVHVRFRNLRIYKFLHKLSFKSYLVGLLCIVLYRHRCRSGYVIDYKVDVAASIPKTKISTQKCINIRKAHNKWQTARIHLVYMDNPSG